MGLAIRAASTIASKSCWEWAGGLLWFPLSLKYSEGQKKNRGKSVAPED
jgi:hypothetical protein